jgi:enoyl-CoA hydratase
MEYKNFQYEEKDEVGILTINRPDKLNALNTETIVELGTFLNNVKTKGSIRALVVTGAGERAFVAGADVGEFTKLGLGGAFDFSRNFQRVTLDLERMDIPVIGAVHGLALGGGCELALSCHVRILSEKAKFGLPELGLGVMPGAGGTQRLTRLIGKGRALWALLTGDMIGAEDALQYGLGNLLVKPEELMATSLKAAEKMASKAPLAVKMTLNAVNFGSECHLDTGLVIEAIGTNVVLASEDFEEGVSAFMEKRSPKKFTGK